MCRNGELRLMMSWVGCLLKGSELIILFAEIPLKISVIPILLRNIYLVALKQSTQLILQLNSSFRHTIVTLIGLAIISILWLYRSKSKRKNKHWYFVTKIVLTVWEKKIKAEDQEFIQTVKCQKKFW